MHIKLFETFSTKCYLTLLRSVRMKLDGCIVWNVHNTVRGSKRLPIGTCHRTQCRLRWGLPPYL